MAHDVKADESPAVRWRRRLKRWALRLSLTLVIVVILGSMLLGYAEHRTSQASFCVLLPQHGAVLRNVAG